MGLEIMNLNKTFKNLNRPSIHSVKDFHINIESGKIYALVGQNGAGKTTAIKCILGFLKPSNGNIQFGGESIEKALSNSKVGYLPEILSFPTFITGRQYLKSIAMLRNIADCDFQVLLENMCKKLEMESFIDRKIGTLSKGMKRKIAYIQAILNKPELLILDEPTDGLDPVSRREILNNIKALALSGTTILITSHLLADLEKIANSIGLMNNGTIVNMMNLDERKSGGKESYIDLEDWYYESLCKKGYQDDTNN